MHIGKRKTKWDIFCRIKNNNSDQDEKGFQLSFTPDDFVNFVPPDGQVSDFNLRGELGSNHSKPKTGIYKGSSAYCLVGVEEGKLYFHGISHDWQKLKELAAKIVSSASMEPMILHTQDTPLKVMLIIRVGHQFWKKNVV
jgi:hypothetical protein